MTEDLIASLRAAALLLGVAGLNPHGVHDGETLAQSDLLSEAADALEARPPAIEARGVAGTREAVARIISRTARIRVVFDSVQRRDEYVENPEEIADLILSALAQQPMGEALAEIAAERRRQVEVHGWSLEHDDGHTHGEIANAAADFAMPGQHPIKTSWAYGSKVIDKEPGRQQLVKAGALIVAEIERLDRAALAGAEHHQDG